MRTVRIGRPSYVGDTDEMTPNGLRMTRERSESDRSACLGRVCLRCGPGPRLDPVESLREIFFRHLLTRRPLASSCVSASPDEGTMAE